jgi:LysM repeat protein
MIGFFGFLLVSAWLVNPTASFHIASKGETLFSISRAYGMNIYELKQLNKIQDTGFVLSIGDTIWVFKKDEQKTNPNYQYHTVTEGETIYAISRKYTNISFEQLVKINNLGSDYIIHNGQKLIVGGSLPEPSVKSIAEVYRELVKNTNRKKEESVQVEPTKAAKSAEEIEPSKALVKELSVTKKNQELVKSVKITDEKLFLIEKFESENSGKSAKCISMTIPGSTVNCAFFNEAKDGAVVRVRNVKNNKAVYLKVLGKLPNLARDKEVCIKISESAAQILDIDISKFLVEVEF